MDIHKLIIFIHFLQLVVLSLLKGLGNTLLVVEGVKLLLSELLERRSSCQSGLDKSHQNLSKIETETLCLLLAACIQPSNCAHVDAHILGCLMKALKVDGLSSDDPAVFQPCVTVLQNLTSALYESLETDIKDELFHNLVFLFRNNNGDIRNASKDALLRININFSTIVRFLELILAQCCQTGSTKRLKRKNSLTHNTLGLSQDSYNREETTLYLLGSLLDILILKKDITKRESLIQPLFQVLAQLFSDEWLRGLRNQNDKENGSPSDIPESVTAALRYAQQATLLILKDITDSLLLDRPLKGDIYNKCNINLLVECARSTKDLSTRNHVFLLFSSVAKFSSGWISEHIIDIFNVIGESAVKQNDSHSQRVLEDLISTLVPCWLSKTNSIGELLQIFIKALPGVAEVRRMTLMVYLLRSLGERESLGVLIFHLFRSFIVRISASSDCQGNLVGLLSSSAVILKEWEYMFAVQLSNQYSCRIWFPCLVKLLQEINMHFAQEEYFRELHLAMHFILHKLQDTELVFELESGQDTDDLQVTLGALLEQVVLQLQLVNVRSKQLSLSRDDVKELKECSNKVLKTITMWMAPSMYFAGIAQLLGHADGNIKKKTLGLLCETIKEHGLVQQRCKGKRKKKQKSGSFRLHIDGSAVSSFNELCLKIVELIASTADDANTPVKLAAISSLEVLTKEFPSDNVVFATCLTCVVKQIGSADLAVSSGSLRTTGALISVLGSKALMQLPPIMKHMFKRAHEVSTCPIGKSGDSHTKLIDGVSSYKLPLLLSILITLEAVIANLGGFLNPYLEDILDLVILHPEYVLELDVKMKLKASTVRKLLTEKLPVRLMLPPLTKTYSKALKCGEASISLAFEMLANMIRTMDRSSIGSYHVKIFEQCLAALDLRRQLPESVKNINMVEESVIRAMIILTMKLTETMFRPLFLHSLEWAESELEGSESAKSINLDRNISFYKLVNKLTEQHRSLFVPYFKYLLDGCTRYLSEDQVVDSISSTQKRKKAKVGDTKAKKVLSPKQWHLRALILKSLYQCFLYDTTDLRFLDTSNYEVLLKPIVSQLVVEPPAPPEVLLDVPAVEEVDELLVLCLGQMAVTVRSDVLWKQLNHEVLMQTRNEKVRPKILGLKIVKYLVDHLKEEYLVFLPETISFLGELLEDVELPVKTLTREIMKEMEILSGQDLAQYL